MDGATCRAWESTPLRLRAPHARSLRRSASRRLRLRGVWRLLYTAWHRAERRRIGRHPDPSAAIMDSQSVKTVEESAGIRGEGAHKRVKGRKRHLLVDTRGLPVASYVIPADVHDT